jgi:3-oxoacyl-(acyl-carrier-protein) synthase III
METFLIDVPMPAMGATVAELTVIDLKVAPGRAVTKGEKLAELESDKSVFEFESPCAGTLRAWHCRAGDIVPTGGAFVRIETGDAAMRHLEARAERREADETKPRSERLETAKTAVTAEAKPSGLVSPISPGFRPPAPASSPWTPRAAKLAREAGLDPLTLTSISATGPGGSISGDDVVRYLATHPPASTGAVMIAPSPQPQAPNSKPSDETVRISGVGYAVPKNIRPTSEILKAFPGRTEEEMVRLTGIKERRYAGEDETATGLAVTAVRRALAQAGLAATQIDGVVLATIIPDQPVPAMASALARELGVPRALAFDLNAACSGWLYALEVGRAFIRSGTAKTVVVVTAELLSRITNPRDHETAFLFGDGAGAAILTDAPGGHRLHRMALSGDARLFDAIQRRGGGAARPVPQPGGADRDDFYLQLNGAVVFKSAVIAFADMIESVLARHALRPDDVAWIVPHQANERILRAVGKRVSIPYEKFVVTIGKYGNTSGASVSMALGWGAAEGIFQPGDKIIFCSVGAGLTFAGGLLVW